MRSQRWLRPLRIIIALIIFAGFLVLFSDVKGKLPSSSYKVLTYLQLLPSVLKFIVLPGVAGFMIILLVTLFSGRVYCSILCPLGIMQDAISYVWDKIPVKKKRRRFKKALDYIRYPILGASVISLFFTGVLAINWLDPYANFGKIASNLYQPVYIAIRNLVSKGLMAVNIYSVQPFTQKEFTPLTFFFALSVFLLILIMVIYRDRLFCNTICPVGAILGLLSKISFLKIAINRTSCTQCGNCRVVCKANCINIKRMQVDESRCVSCFNCINVCNDSAIGLKQVWFKNEAEQPVTDTSKRTFLKAGLLFIGTYPLLAKAGEGEEDHPSFHHRGPISPPGSQSIEHLKEKCIGCQLCIAACPTKVLQPAFLEYGFTGMMLPRMANKTGFCSYKCVKCSEVCPTGAILPLSDEEKVTTQIGRVYFNKNLCIVETEGTACGSCSEHCPTQAVYMVPYHDGLTIPETNPDICVGCGACEYACPAENPHVAIYVVPNKVHKVAQKPVAEEVEAAETEDFPF